MHTVKNMRNQFKKFLKKDNRMEEELKNEPRFADYEFIEELLPLLGDYFYGNFKLKGNDIICAFPNGQTIKLSAVEILCFS